MKPGPAKGGSRAAETFVTKATAAWCDPLPDWLRELAQLADIEGLRGAAKRIGYSPSAVSFVLSGRYSGDIARVEEMVRGALMALSVECPVLGEIGRDRCLSEQKEPFRATSRHRAQLYHACRSGCPHARRRNTETNDA